MKTNKLMLLLLAIIVASGQLRAQTDEKVPNIVTRSEFLNNEGVKKADAEQFEAAIELFRQAIGVRADNATAYGNLGTAFYRTGQLQDATAALKKAIQLNPNYSEAYSALGSVYTDLGKYDDAVEVLKKAVVSRPGSAIANFNLGCVHIELRKFKEAVAALKRAAELDPNHAETFVQSGYALSRLKKYGEAIKQLEQAIRLQPRDVEAQYFLGQLYLLDRNRQSALAQYRQIFLLDKGWADKFHTQIYGRMLVHANKQ